MSTKSNRKLLALFTGFAAGVGITALATRHVWIDNTRLSQTNDTLEKANARLQEKRDLYKEKSSFYKNENDILKGENYKLRHPEIFAEEDLAPEEIMPGGP